MKICCKEFLETNLNTELKEYCHEYYFCENCGSVHMSFNDGSIILTEEIEIEGFDKLTNKQKKHVLEVSKNHLNSSGLSVKAGKRIKKVWINNQGTTCIRCHNDEWYHYYLDGSWG